MGHNRGAFPKRNAVPAIGGRPVEFSCIYAVGPQAGQPLKIGFGHDPQRRLSDLQAGNWVELFIHFHVWAIDNALARRVEAACHRLLEKAEKCLCGGWFDITPEWAQKVIWFAAQEQNIPLYTNQQVIDLMVPKEELDIADIIRDSAIIDRRGKSGQFYTQPACNPRVDRAYSGL
jgi:hypothetical protein